MIEVAFAVDDNTTVCAFVAIHSMLRHASCPIAIIILYEDKQKKPGADWEKRLLACGFNFSIRYQKVDVSAFRGCKDLFNSHTNYLKIYAPIYAAYSRLIYSDVDVVFSGDIAELALLDLGGKIIARNGGEPCKGRSRIEREALYHYGRNEEDVYYGSGLAIIDVGSYKKTNKAEFSERIASKHSQNLCYHDQTIWNCVFSELESTGIHGKWCQTPPIKKNSPLMILMPGVVHFAGSPKPWDLLGEFFHPSYEIWKQAADAAGIRWHRFTKYLSISNIRRAKRIKTQYNQWIK